MQKKKVVAVELSKDVYISLMQQARQTVKISNSEKKWSEVKVGVSAEELIPQFSRKRVIK